MASHPAGVAWMGIGHWRKVGEGKLSNLQVPDKLFILLALPRGLEPLFSP
jgi:hypothetical protein